MKIEAIIIDKEVDAALFLKKCLLSKFPEISIHREVEDFYDASKLIKSGGSNLVFTDINTFNRFQKELVQAPVDFVCMSDNPEDAIAALRVDACGFMLKPLNVSDVVTSVGSVLRKLSQRINLPFLSPAFSADGSHLPHTKLFGIPTMEGIEFLYAHEIIRCEGLQKCTRLVLTRKKNMVSSYNIGEFRKLLEEHGFFACHKSHLINLMHVKSCTKDGFLFLTDNSPVPLARRKRTEFLQQLKHL